MSGLNISVASISLFFIIFNTLKLINLFKGTEMEVMVVDFKEKLAKRYMYFIPIIQFEDSEKEWIENPKMDKKLLGKKIKVIFFENKIFEEKDFFKCYFFLFVSLSFFIFALFNLRILFL